MWLQSSELMTEHLCLREHTVSVDQWHLWCRFAYNVLRKQMKTKKQETYSRETGTKRNKSGYQCMSSKTQQLESVIMMSLHIL